MSPDPKTLLEKLTQDQQLAEFPPAAQAEAKRLAAEEEASPEQVAALPEALALAVLEGHVRRKQAALPAALASSAHKPLAKAAKKALYRLKSQGVEVPEVASEERAAPGAPAATPTDSSEAFPCLLSPFTGEGEQALLVAEPLRGGGLEIFRFLLKDDTGLAELDRGAASRSAFRKDLREIRQGRAGYLEVPLARARQELADAAGRNVRTHTPFPPGADEALRHLGVTPSATETAWEPPEPEDARWAQRGDQLHREPEVLPWLPPENQLRLLGARLTEVAESPLQLSEQQKREQLAQKVKATARAFFTPEISRIYALRLRTMAELFDATRRPDAAHIARAEARRLYHGVAEPSRFAEAMFEKVLRLTQEMAAGGQLPVPGEVPTQAAGRRPEEPAQRPSGLILPGR